MMKTVRVGVIGVGNMGSGHAQGFLDGKYRGAELAAVCDIDAAKLERWSPRVAVFEDSRKLIRSGKVDAVVIATPHYDHTTIGIDALKNGLHTLVEKPISVHKADAQKLIAAHTRKRQVFAAMFNQRTDPHYIKLRDLVKGGELGRVLRAVWIITNWFRTEAYYASGGWRATWGGEGGGVLLNQCPHNLDLWQWMLGMPKRVHAACAFGKYHQIEVEDDVTAFMEYADGATGTFITTTGEAPGTNRLEVTGTRGKVVIEGGKITFTRNVTPSDEFSRATNRSFATPERWEINIPVSGSGGQHGQVLQNYVDAIREGKPLIAPAREGIHSVELANAMLMSAFTGKTVELPLSAPAYARLLKRRIATSTFKKAVRKDVVSDIAASAARA